MERKAAEIVQERSAPFNLTEEGKYDKRSS